MIDSLEMLERRRRLLEKDLNKSKKRLSTMWNDLFHDRESRKPKNKAQRIISIIYDSSAIVDGFLLGWKLYNRFKRKKS